MRNNNPPNTPVTMFVGSVVVIMPFSVALLGLELATLILTCVMDECAMFQHQWSYGVGVATLVSHRLNHAIPRFLEVP